MKQKWLSLVLAVLAASFLKAQPKGSFTHYSSDDGLSENTVMDMLQDSRGNMWFSTWNGINKFDGYTFKTYKARQDNQISLTSNRVDHMVQDRYGFIWLQTYDDRAFRFDPRTEVFEAVPAEGQPGSQMAVSSVKVLPDGTVWLLGADEGAVRVTVDSTDYKLSVMWYSPASECLHFSQVFDVGHMDGCEWVLSDNGLGCFASGTTVPNIYFENGESGQKQGFYTMEDCGDCLFFGSDNGMVWVYQKKDKIFHPIQFDASSRICGIKYLQKLSQVVVATLSDGFFICRLSGDGIIHYPSVCLPAEKIRSIYKDSSDEIWFEQNVVGEVAHFNPYTRKLKREKVYAEPTNTDRSRPAFHIHEDIFGMLWVHPYGGGFSYFDRENNCLRPFYNSLTGENWRFSNKIHSAFSDRQGNLWMCTHSKGLEKITFRTERFRLQFPVNHSYESLSNEVRALCEDKDGYLWVGLKDGMLRVYDRNWNEIGYLTEAGTVAHSGPPLFGNTYFVMQDSKGNLWIATKGAGVVKAEPLPGKFHYKLTRYRYNADDVYSLADDNVYCIYEDHRGRIWMATFANGISYLIRDAEGKEIFISHRNNLKGFPIKYCSKVRCITGDASGHIWIGTTVGLLMVDEAFDHPEDARFYHYLRAPEKAQALSNNDIHWIKPTRQGELYVATFGGGLNKLIELNDSGQARFKAYTVRDGLPSDILLSIQEDKKGQLWISTENGLSKFTPDLERFENFQNKYSNSSIRFSEAASAYVSDGNMLFGTNHGIFYFNPDSIQKSIYVPPIVLSQLLLANERVSPGEHSLLKRTLDDVDELQLSHKENIFTIQYAALDFTAPSDIQYAYMLDGFEKNWNYVGKQRTATYTNLPKGHYVFKVRSTNADGVWSDNMRTLDIEVLPSFWETPFAYFLYVFFLLLIMVTAVYILFTIYRLKHKVAMEQQLTNMKLRFFTDISHELRTPLTLITAPLEYVLQNTVLPAEAREQLLVVERNSNRMLRLINQILDFRKIQNKKMKLQVQRLEIVSFVRKIMDNFEAVAEEHQIDFVLETETEAVYLWVDADKFEKIVYNLLSNAFKYTPKGKVITVFIHDNAQSVSVGVQDQGIGIAENKKKSLFVRFENLVDSSLFNQSSSGIGLSLVKELVEMHKASISVDSRLGEGSCFKVDFLKGKEHYDETVEILQNDVGQVGAKLTKVAEDGTVGGRLSLDDAKFDEKTENSKSTMLLVEDNTELRVFLRSIFMSEFRVVEAANGIEGAEKALKLLPDIIISDVMMPGKDGIQMMRELHDNMTTSHIPMVLLTAKTAIESKLEGLEYGADDYITKPFSATYLKARVKNILARRERLQELYREKLMGTSILPVEPIEEDTKVPEMSPNDRKFMDKLMGLMERNLDNGDLIVDDLVKDMAVSRSVFFKKLKSLTGLAPVEFIKEVRIKRAVQLIETGEYSMTQIAYMVGINDPRYFSKCFKQKMGMTPTEYREKKCGLSK